jgi:hypothetical protein
MKKVVLFSRNDLTNLYGGISNHLSDTFEIIHLAYSDRDEEILKRDYQIGKIINFQKEIRFLIENEQLDLNLIQQIDELIIEKTNNRFCLNSCIQSDRTFAGMDYHEVLVLVQVYYKFWNNLMLEKHFQYLLHEPVALYFLQIALIVCKKYEAEYLTQIQVFGENEFNWIFVSADDGFAVELPGILSSAVKLNEENRDRAKRYIETFRKNFELLLPQIASKNKSLANLNPLSFTLKMFITSLKYCYRNLTRKLPDFASTDHIERYAFNNIPNLSDKLKNQWDEYFHIRYDDFDPEQDYYYFPMHTEPEAVVLYWGDGIYKNQIKLIENIAGQLPPNCFLYVKYHPVMKDERNYIDYKRIKAIPNVKLLGQNTPGKLIISKCKGILTINGTSGFEAILLNKPVYVFGNSFYDLSDRVFKVINIRDLRVLLYENHKKTFNDDEKLYRFVYAFLKISHSGYTAYYSNYKELLNINHMKNVEEIAKGIKQYLAS